MRPKFRGSFPFRQDRKRNFLLAAPYPPLDFCAWADPLQKQFHGAIDGHAHDSTWSVYPAVGVEKILLGLPVAPQIHSRIRLNAGRRRQGPRAGKGRGNERAGILGFLKVIEEPDQ
jgi:hypothetical protein